MGGHGTNVIFRDTHEKMHGGQPRPMSRFDAGKFIFYFFLCCFMYIYTAELAWLVLALLLYEACFALGSSPQDGDSGCHPL